MTMTALTAYAPTQDSRFNEAQTWSAFGASWSSAERKTLECCAIRIETADVRTFVFRCPDFVALAFEPGQFITLSLTIDGQSQSRCYTLSSTPTRPFSFAITVKRVPGGPVSNWLHDHLEVGSRLLATGPAGIFTPVGHPQRKLLYLSAGSGVTPLMAMTRAAFDLGSDPDIAFVHSARTPQDIIFRDELAHLQAAQRHLKVFAICEASGAEADWQGPVGRLDLALLERLVPDFREREVFTCGPQGYMGAVQRTLREGGFDLSHYHQESFTIGSPTAFVETVPTTASDALFTITLARSGKVFSMPGDQTVLTAAKRAGAIVPSSCGQGLCGTCKTALLDGQVEMQHAGGIRQREIDRGFRLLCCSKPTSDLVLDL
ncbi:hybrid-cluster NAD(P)-dependent oxidoreductase [Pseudomonas oryzihabitans]|uniref:Hybrid-cluster NAD(P)-dependent oxidoreductase n=2 Tax=Pseudomonas oryzihabitans TaxID=47885 RepID=A0A0U4NXL8_9PSED|nr:hybrid-cluster NAD(P)-dependent oxidoreductase [Pseudomonas oryzihabitans]